MLTVRWRSLTSRGWWRPSRRATWWCRPAPSVRSPVVRIWGAHCADLGFCPWVSIMFVLVRAFSRPGQSRENPRSAQRRPDHSQVVTCRRIATTLRETLMAIRCRFASNGVQSLPEGSGWAGGEVPAAALRKRGGEVQAPVVGGEVRAGGQSPPALREVGGERRGAGRCRP